MWARMGHESSLGLSIGRLQRGWAGVYKLFTEGKLQWRRELVRMVEMKVLLRSVLGFFLGTFVGWDRPGMRTEGEGEGEIASSRRKLVDGQERNVAELDPVFEGWGERIRRIGTGEELKKIFGELGNSEVARKLELQEMLVRRWAEVYPEEALAFLGTANAGWELLPVVFAKWMELDAEKAMIAIRESGNLKKMKPMVLEELLKGDKPQVTLDYLRRTKSFELPWGVKSIEEWLSLMRARTNEVEEMIMEQIAEEGKSMEYRTREVLKLLGAVKMEEGADAAVKWAESLDKGVARYALEGVMEAWVKIDPKAVVVVLDEWAGLEKPSQAMIYATNSVSRLLARELTLVDFSAALSWFDRRGSVYVAGTVGQIIGKRMRDGELSPVAVFDEIARLKSGHELLRKRVMEAIWEGGSAEDVVKIAEVISGKEESRTKILAMAGLLRGLAVKQPLEAAKMIERLLPGEERSAIVREVFKDHRKNSLTKDFVQVLPIEEYGTAVAALYEKEPKAGDVWGYSPEVYPGKFAARLSEVSDDGERARAMGRLGSYWGQVDPIGALKWARDLPGEDQVMAMKEVSRGWSKQDPVAVTRYLGELSEGGIRDSVISGLVAGAGELDPASTWEWGGMIGDEDLRREARESVLGWWAEVDPEGAIRALEGDGISNPEREALRAVLVK